MTNDTLAKLAACPFCGKTDSPETHEAPYPGQYRAVCNYHKGGCGATVCEDSEQEAIDRWNRRALTAQAPAPKLSDKLITLLKCLPEAPFKEHLTAEIEALTAQALPATEPTPDPKRADFVRVARIFAEAYGLHEDAPGYLPRSPEAVKAFEPHGWVIAAMMQAYADGKYAQQAAQATAGWQPIETAPKNGGAILIANDAFVSQGYWVNAVEDAPYEMGHDAGFVDCFHDYFYCSRSFGNEQYMRPGNQPTHWQPLPDAPAALPQPQPQSAQAKGDAS